MTEKPAPRLDIRSPEEFAMTCEAMARRLHYLNRTAIGESFFASQVAETLSALGRTFARDLKDDDVQKAFGDGYTPGTIDRDERAVALHALMFPKS